MPLMRHAGGDIFTLLSHQTEVKTAYTWFTEMCLFLFLHDGKEARMKKTHASNGMLVLKQLNH